MQDDDEEVPDYSTWTFPSSNNQTVTNTMTTTKKNQDDDEDLVPDYSTWKFDKAVPATTPAKQQQATAAPLLLEQISLDAQAPQQPAVSSINDFNLPRATNFFEQATKAASTAKPLQGAKQTATPYGQSLSDQVNALLAKCIVTW